MHEYKYLVDGRWQEDRNALTRPNQYGTLNNVVEVGPSNLDSSQKELYKKAAGPACENNIELFHAKP
jgi:hypothetical protein